MHRPITIVLDPDASSFGTSLKIEGIRISYDRLVSLLGEPTRLDNGKIQVEWVVTFSDGEVLVIYDWKQESAPEEITEWNVAAKSHRVAYRIDDILDGKIKRGRLTLPE